MLFVGRLRRRRGGETGQRTWQTGTLGEAPKAWRGSVPKTISRAPPSFLFSSLSLNFVSTVAHFPPPDSVNSLPCPLPPRPLSGPPSPARVPTGRCRLLSGTRTARAGNKSRFHDSLPSSNAPNLSPPGSQLSARGEGLAVQAVRTAAGARAGRGGGSKRVARSGEKAVWPGRGKW